MHLYRERRGKKCKERNLMQNLLLGLNELIWVKRVIRGQKILVVTVVRRALAPESPSVPATPP